MLKIQPSFAAGEVAPGLYGRVDLAKYQIALATCLNMMVMAQGGVQNRPGTSFVGPQSSHDVRHRSIPFQFNTEQAYALQFGHQNMRVVKDGAFVLEASKPVLSATQANPVVLEVTGHGWSNGDLVYLSGIKGMTELNGRFVTVANAAANTFELAGIDGTAYGAFLEGGTAARVYTLTTPYAEADLPLLKFVQSNDTMTITHPGYAPRDLTRSGHAAWALNVITFASEQPAPTAPVATPISVTGATTWEYVVTAVNATNGEESLPSATASATYKTEAAWDASAGDLIEITWTNAAGADSYNVYKKRNGIFGFIGNAADGTEGFIDDKIRADTTDAPPGSFNPFSGAGDWPSTVTYHEQRKWFGATTNKPQTLWATASSAFKNMNKATPTQDDDAIIRTLASRQANEIRHMVSMEVLVVFTSGAEWKVWPGSQADVITPANANARAQAYSGSSHVPPLLINNTVLFVQEKGSIVRDLRYEFASDTWNGIDMSILAAHLFEGHVIKEWGWAQVPHKIIWAVRDDGVLLGFTYMKDQEVYAWSRHVTDGEVESVCVIGEGNEDVLYLSIKRTVDGATVRYVERMESRLYDQLRDAWFLDCALAYDGNNDDASVTLTLDGASYAPGEYVTLSASGPSAAVPAIASTFITTTLPAYLASLEVLAGTFTGAWRQALGGKISPYFMFEAMAVAPEMFTAAKIRAACALAIDYMTVGPYQTGTLYGANRMVRSTAGRVFQANIGGTTGGAEPVAGFAAASLGAPFVSDGGVTWELLPERLAGVQIICAFPSAWQWYLVGIDSDLFSRIRPDSNDAYVGMLVAACLAGGVDAAWLGTATGHGGLTRRQVLALLVQHNITDDITNNLAVTFQSGLDPNGSPFAIQYLADNCEAWRGVYALAALHGIAGDAAAAAAATAFSVTLRSGILALWDSGVGRFRTYFGDTGHGALSGETGFVAGLRFHIYPLMHGVLSTTLEIDTYGRPVLVYVSEAAPTIWTGTYDTFIIAEFFYTVAQYLGVVQGRDTAVARAVARSGTAGAIISDVAMVLKAAALSFTVLRQFEGAQVGRTYELRSGADKVRVTVLAFHDEGSALVRLERDAPASLQVLATADWALCADEVSGLWHLEGRMVDLFADGSKMPETMVSEGVAMLERPASRVLCGLPYVADMETLDIELQPTAQGKEKRIGEVSLKVDQTRGLSVGPTSARLVEVKDRTTEPYGEPIAPYTGTRKITIQPEWNTNGRIFIRTTSGLPARILAAIPDVVTGNA